MERTGSDRKVYPFTCYPHKYAHHLKSRCDLNDNCFCQVEVCNRHHHPKTASGKLMAGPFVPSQGIVNSLYFNSRSLKSSGCQRGRTVVISATAAAPPRQPPRPRSARLCTSRSRKIEREQRDDVSCGLEPSDDEPGVGWTMRGLSDARSLNDTTSCADMLSLRIPGERGAFRGMEPR